VRIFFGPGNAGLDFSERDDRPHPLDSNAIPNPVFFPVDLELRYFLIEIHKTERSNRGTETLHRSGVDEDRLPVTFYPFYRCHLLPLILP
jgi:hypothetical protein